MRQVEDRAKLSALVGCRCDGTDFQLSREAFSQEAPWNDAGEALVDFPLCFGEQRFGSFGHLGRGVWTAADCFV